MIFTENQVKVAEHQLLSRSLKRFAVFLKVHKTDVITTAPIKTLRHLHHVLLCSELGGQRHKFQPSHPTALVISHLQAQLLLIGSLAGGSAWMEVADSCSAHQTVGDAAWRLQASPNLLQKMPAASRQSRVLSHDVLLFKGQM